MQVITFFVLDNRHMDRQIDGLTEYSIHIPFQLWVMQSYMLAYLVCTVSYQLDEDNIL